MEKGIKIFENIEFGSIRIINLQGKFYVVGKDVAEILGYSNPRDAISRHCKGVVKHDSFKEGGQNIALIPEGDLYRLVIKSKLPKAEEFEKWVMEKVLPQIRATGGYIPLSEKDSEADIMAKALLIAQNTLDKKEELIKAKEKELLKTKTELEVKNKFMRQIAISENSLLVREVAKVASKNGVIVGEKKLWNILRDWGLIFKNSREPKQSYINNGYFEIVSGTRESKGKIYTYQTTRVTGKGQIYIIKKLLEEMEN